MDNIFEFIFDNNTVNIVLDNQRNIWFKAIDIGKILHYKDIKKTMKTRIDKEDKVMYNQIKEDNLEQNQTIFINESGLYTLLLRSNKDEAIEFQRWITKDVLPSIRKKGEYVLSKKIKKSIESEFKKIITSHETKIKEQNELISKLSRKLTKDVYEKTNRIYIHQFLTYEEFPLFKIGFSKNLNKRIPVYNTGNDNNGIVVYDNYCYDCKLVEKVLKHKLKYNLYDKNKELVNIDLNKLINTIDETIHDLDDKIIKDNAIQLLSTDENNDTIN